MSVVFYPLAPGSSGEARYSDSPQLTGADCRRLLASSGIRRSRLARKGGVAEPGCHNVYVCYMYVRVFVCVYVYVCYMCVRVFVCVYVYVCYMCVCVSQAALVGGTTMVIGHVLPERNESLLDAYEHCRSTADPQACCDYALHVGVTWWGPKVPHLNTLQYISHTNALNWIESYCIELD